jgi:hypothetical protein
MVVMFGGNLISLNWTHAWKQLSGIIIRYTHWSIFKRVKDVNPLKELIPKYLKESFYSFKNLLIDFRNLINLTSIGSLSFSKCLSLIKINLQGIKFIKIGNVVFSKCFNLEEILIDDQFFWIGGTHLFYKCRKLKQVEIQQTIKEPEILIKPYVFAYCENLARIILPRSFNHLCSFAFYRSKNLSINSITLVYENWTC